MNVTLSFSHSGCEYDMSSHTKEWRLGCPTSRSSTARRYYIWCKIVDGLLVGSALYDDLMLVDVPMEVKNYFCRQLKLKAFW